MSKPSETLLARISDPKERDRRRHGVAVARLRLELAQLVTSLRQRAGLTQSALAKLIGTSQPNISRLENGEHAALPSLDLLVRIADALHGRLEVCIVGARKHLKQQRAADGALQRRK